MSRVLLPLALLLGCWVELTATNETQTHFAIQTNGGGVFRTWVTYRTNVSANPRYGYTNHLAASNRLPADVFRRLNERWASEPQFVTTVFSFTNAEFLHLLPETLTHRVFTNFIAQTNGRTTRLWSKRQHPVLWPTVAPSVEWDRRCVAWGMKGLTALSPCWQQEGAPGQVPVTLLTPRHGYTRGHGMGPAGFQKTFNGKKVWFVTLENKVVEAKVEDAVVRAAPGRDYTILMFRKDLPLGIQPMRVLSATAMRAHYPWPQGSNPIVLRSEQTGNLSTDLPGFFVPFMKGGDSGSASMIPLFGELVFFGGSSTSAPTPQMQEDIDELCRRQGVDARDYQLQWVDLSQYPAYQ
jgi:hypothetical protein